MLPDVSEALTEWEVPVTIKTVTQVTANFQPADQVATRTILAVVQNAQRDRLTTTQIEAGQQYKTLHSKEPVNRGEFLFFEGKDYKIIDDGDWQRYGYTEALCEATNKAPI